MMKRVLTKTEKEYISRIHAAGFLRYNHELSITEIAYKLGFSSSAIFARSFNRMYG
ncbi:hypothetical protein SH2C18_19170 [Clostridium sediminicola]